MALSNAAPNSAPYLTLNGDPGPNGYVVPGFSTDANGALMGGPSAGATNLVNPGVFNGGISLDKPYVPGAGSPPPTTPAPPSGGSSGGGLLNTDPGVLNALALENMGIGQLDAGLKSARERAIINFGDPSLAEQAGFGIDPQAGAFAQQNYLSGNATLARLDKQHQLARKAVIDQLASHGILQSGDLGYGEGQADQSYGNNVYDAKNAVLDQLASLFNNYLSSRSGYESQTQNARQQAITNFLSNPDAYSQFFGGQAPPPPATDPPATTPPPKTAPAAKKKAQPVYVNSPGAGAHSLASLTGNFSA